MSVKTLTITEEAYERLASMKEKDESFSQVIVRYFPRHSLLELAGIFTHEEAKELKAYIKSRRTASRKRLERIAGAFS